jgi:hypothetical protein
MRLGHSRARDAFLLDLAVALAGLTDIGDGGVARAIRTVQRRYFDPPILPHAGKYDYVAERLGGPT